MTARLIAIDLLRGVVMLLMTLDHVRDHFTIAHFSPTDLSQTTAALFFTRWITHFCAPVFFLLSGLGIYLGRQSGKSLQHLTIYLLLRGLLLMLLEVTIISLAWSFLLEPGLFELGVVWALGCSMVLMAIFIHLPLPVILFVGIALIAGHNLLDSITLTQFPTANGALAWQGWLWSIMHIPHGPVLYPLLPWCGVMMLGYGLGPIYILTVYKRQRLLSIIGFGLCLAFVGLRLHNGYGDPKPWTEQSTPLFTVLAWLNTHKYPPSLMYLLMTLGPAFFCLAWMEKLSGRIVQIISLFGQVPLFYYLLHLYVIHALTLTIGVLHGYPATDFLTPFFAFPKTWGFSLSAVYLFWLGIVILLYPLCAWYADLKSRYRNTILSYL